MSFDPNVPYIGYPPPPMVEMDVEPLPAVLPDIVQLPEVIEPEDPPPVDWVPATRQTAYTLMRRAFLGGREGWDSSPLFIIRSYIEGGLIPGKLAIKHGAAYVPFRSKEVAVNDFELLCANPNDLQWVSTRDDEIPDNAIPAGNTAEGEPLFIGRITHRGSLTPGKVQPSHNRCYISFGGSEISYRKYEILCEN